MHALIEVEKLYEASKKDQKALIAQALMFLWEVQRLAAVRAMNDEQAWICRKMQIILREKHPELLEP